MLRDILIATARSNATLTYADLARALDLRPPRTIRQTALLLEALMREQAEAGEPQLASLVTSRAGERVRERLPAPGFFMKMRELGLYDGPDTGASGASLCRSGADGVWGSVGE